MIASQCGGKGGGEEEGRGANNTGNSTNILLNCSS